MPKFIRALLAAALLAACQGLQAQWGGLYTTPPSGSGGGGSGTPGGSSGQLQINNAGAFGGITMSGDATIDASGVITVTTVNGQTLCTVTGTFVAGDSIYYTGASTCAVYHPLAANSFRADHAGSAPTEITLPLPIAQGGVGTATPFAVVPETGTYQVLAADFTNFATISVASGTFNITLVASGSQPAAGKWIRIVNYGSGVVTIVRSGQNINGGTSSLVLPAASATAPTAAFITSDGTNYFAMLAVSPLGNVATATALAANPTNCSAGNYPLGIDASGNVENCTAAGGSAALSGITDAAGANTLANGDNAQIWRWALTSDAKSAFTFKESAAATNGTGTQFLVDISTLAGSTAGVIRIAGNGGGDNLRIDPDGTVYILGYSKAGGVAGGNVNVRGGLGTNAGNGGKLKLNGGAGGNFGADGGDLEMSGGTGNGGNPDGHVTVKTGGGTTYVRFNSTTQHLSHLGTAPTMGACGASPTVAGKDQAMTVTVGTGGSATACAVTFAKTFTNAPACTANSDTDIVALKVVTTTTTVTVSATAAFTASSKLHVLCGSFE